MTRIAENQLARSVLSDIRENRSRYDKYSNEVSSGLKVTDPGDSKFSSTIVQYRQTLGRIESHKTRISAVKAQISFQDNVVQQASEMLVRAKELATQAANEVMGSDQRAQASKEVMAIRDQLVNLANSRYQGKYVFGGADDTNQPYNKAVNYTVPASGSLSERWVYDSAATDPASALTRTVNVTDDVSVDVNTPGNEIFDRAIQGLERLGRAMGGYRTTLTSGAPDGGGTAYTLPADMSEQSKAITDAMDFVEKARQEDVMPERVSLGARLSRLGSAESMLELTKADAEQVLNNLQNADYATSATNLSQAQTALEASYTVSSRILKMTILDYL